MYTFSELKSTFNLRNKTTSNIKLQQVSNNLALHTKKSMRDGDCLNDVRSANNIFFKKFWRSHFTSEETNTLGLFG